MYAISHKISSGDKKQTVKYFCFYFYFTFIGTVKAVWENFDRNFGSFHLSSVFWSFLPNGWLSRQFLMSSSLSGLWNALLYWLMTDMLGQVTLACVFKYLFVNTWGELKLLVVQHYPWTTFMVTSTYMEVFPFNDKTHQSRRHQWALFLPAAKRQVKWKWKKEGLMDFS